MGCRHHGPPLLGRVGVGRGHALPVGQAGGLAPRRDPQSDGRALARSHPRMPARCAPSSLTSSTWLPPSSTSPASRSPTRSTGSSRSRCTGRRSPASFTDGAAPEHRTQQYFETLGNRGMYKDGWWLAMKTERIPWVLTPEALASVRAGRLGPRRGPGGALLPARRLLAGEGPCRRPSREGAGAQGPVLGGGRALQGVAAARGPLDVLRHRAPHPREDDLRVPRRRPERDARNDPEDLQPLVHDQRRSRRARGGRRRCDRRRGRPPRRLHALRQGRQAHPHAIR